jgi:hypothetical protein
MAGNWSPGRARPQSSTNEPTILTFGFPVRVEPTSHHAIRLSRRERCGQQLSGYHYIEPQRPDPTIYRSDRVIAYRNDGTGP